MTIKTNAKNRSRRLRKKLYVDEFQRLGFETLVRLTEGADTDAVVDFWLRDAIEKNGLMYGGSSSYMPGSMSGFVSKWGRGSLTEKHRALIKDWLEAQAEVKSFEIGPLVDAYYPEEE